MPSGNLNYVSWKPRERVGRATPLPWPPDAAMLKPSTQQGELPKELRRLVRQKTPRLGEHRCWICYYPMLAKGCGVMTHDLRPSRDHVVEGDECRILIAHRWCNSRRGVAHKPLTDDMRRSCQMHIWDKHRDYWTSVGVQRIPMQNAPAVEDTKQQSAFDDSVINNSDAKL